jgi:hypothetical protein
MAVPRVVRSSTLITAREERFQAVKLDDGKFALVEGDISVRIRDPLPIDPGHMGKIHDYDTLAELLDEWARIATTLEDSGDQESADKMWAADWGGWDTQ